ncbi:hypothetical protein XH99_01450 [Bradyrhizobium nanningense]|uniref:Uncharacterized protein n=1 Tax=Bradyrhizobium nanningense TaxID=1325118 RepID=A0A4V1L3L9_9BRAD|nr:hypothetical protein XH84_33345 [Bradyrhizobium nanningense]RXH38434.1 hypothetical protein XH99_01450 [Bradyrhizobium nanningense]
MHQTDAQKFREEAEECRVQAAAARLIGTTQAPQEPSTYIGVGGSLLFGTGRNPALQVALMCISTIRKDV